MTDNNFYNEVDRRIKKNNQLYWDYLTKRGAFFQHLTTILLAFLALLIGLKPTENQHLIADSFFLATLCLIVLCILCSVGVLYIQVSFSKQNHQDSHTLTKEYIDSKGKKKLQFSRTDMPLYVKYFEKGALISLVLSLISLLVYGYTMTI